MSRDNNGLDPMTKNRFEIEPLQNMNQKAPRDCIESLSNVDLNGKVSPKSGVVKMVDPFRCKTNAVSDTSSLNELFAPWKLNHA